MRFTAALALVLSLMSAASAGTLEQIVSHEDPAFDVSAGRLTIGRDGKVYVSHSRTRPSDDNAYLMVIGKGGEGRFGQHIHYINSGVAANANGVYVVAENHFSGCATVFGPGGFTASFKEFNNSNYDAPQHVEAGATSGDFYCADQRGNRIMRINAKAQKVTPYPIEKPNDFRVCEANKAFYLAKDGVTCVGFDGETRWNVKTGGPFDVGDDGTLYVLQGEKVLTFNSEDGKPGKTISLKVPQATSKLPRAVDLRIFGNELFVKRESPVEIFAAYDIKTGQQTRSVLIEHERLAATFDADMWTAGRAVPFRVSFTTSAHDGDAKANAQPRWRLWARPYGAPDWRELTLKDDSLAVPQDLGGLYEIKLTPETNPRQGQMLAEYGVRGIVEVRAPDSKGSANVLTPNNRVFYGRGEEIPVRVIVRAADVDRPKSVKIRIMQDQRTIGEKEYEATTSDVKFALSKAFTSSLTPGAYRVVVVAPNLTCVAQPIVIGPGIAPSPFLMTQYGDYGPGEPIPDASRVADAFGVRRSARLGINMATERIGGIGETIHDDALVDRLTKDPVATAPEKATFDPPLLQVIAGRGAFGIHEMPILLGNDAVLPMGETVEGIGITDPAKTAETIHTVTPALLPYPAFRGWIWAANWWVWTQHGVAATTSPEQKKAYTDALKRANETGKWDRVLEEVSNRWFNFAPLATEHFNRALREITPDKPTAVSAPYRNAYAYPPITFKNVDEVDLQYQAEQMTVPYHAPQSVDFYKRPGKRAFAHPEIWNDNGTGDQILTTTFQMIMRGVDGIGFSGTLPPGWSSISTDPRDGESGIGSIYRALFATIRPYGPWLATLSNDDRVAIVASSRMFRLDEWASEWGLHFARVKEAYIACLHAHHPASIVFSDDLKPDSLTKYKAVLVVDQRYEMEAGLAEALSRAKSAGVAIFADGTCRAELVKDFTPLGISFNKFEKDHHTWGDDPAYAPVRFPGYVMADVPAVRKALDAIVPPVAEVENPEVLLSQRGAGDGRFVFAVNNTTANLDPGHLHRFALFVTTRVPVTASLKLNVPAGGAVYELFSQTQCSGAEVQADLRSLPMRVFAILPTPIAQVELAGPESCDVGRSFRWSLEVKDAGGKSVATSVPVRVRLIDESGSVIEEQSAVASSAAATGTMTMPRNARVVLEATELFGGKTARMNIGSASAAPAAPFDSTASPPPVDTSAKVIGKDRVVDDAPDARFGPHIRDTILVNNGSLAVMNALNWDENLYAVDVNSGKLAWQKRVGHAFTFAPQALTNGFAIQGFDLTSTQGYHEYLADASGKLERRFALYGISRRRPSRFFTGHNDRMNHFAVAPDASWVAAYGDLGLVVYARDGHVMWKEDHFNPTTPRFEGGGGYVETPTLAALGSDALLMVDGPLAIARSPKDGKELWRAPLAVAGRPQKVIVAEDGRTVVVYLDTSGGRIVILRDGKILQNFPAVGTDISVNADASRIVVVRGNELKFYTLTEGLRWTFPGDDYLVNPRIGADGRVAVSSFMGLTYVLDESGNVLTTRDTDALAVPTWLPGGDLLLATWSGDVRRLDAKYNDRWRLHLMPEATDMRDKLLASDGAPTSRVEGWANSDAKPGAISSSLLTQGSPRITLGINTQPTEAPKSLTDGKPDAPDKPLFDWGTLNWLGENWQPAWIEIDGLRSRYHVTGVTFVEDPAHPESWQRDTQLRYWDEASGQWKFAQTFLADSAIHTHTLDKPIDTSRLRIQLNPGMAGNCRLAELVLHGEVLGSSNPDVAAKRPMVMLFDETEDAVRALIHDHNGLSVRSGDGAFAGNKCLMLEGNSSADPRNEEALGPVVPSWDFAIAEKPEPGQFRFLQFAWRSREPSSTQLTVAVNDLDVASVSSGGDDEPWKVVRVDLWPVFKKPAHLRAIRLSTHGGAVLIDRIAIARTEEDLKAAEK